MGNQISKIFSGLGRFFEYPVKRKPICFYRQEDFTATGEPIKKASDVQKLVLTDYDKLVDLFYSRLAEQRQYNQIENLSNNRHLGTSVCRAIYNIFALPTPLKKIKSHQIRNLVHGLCGFVLHVRAYDRAEMKEQDRRWSMQKVVQRFPGWNEITIANLHSLFLLFDNQTNGMLGFDDFGAVLESLGDESSMELRKEKFMSADSDNDGWITYDEFLSLVYNFNPQEEGRLQGLALLCNDVAENIQFVSNLTVGEQLEYGLF